MDENFENLIDTNAEIDDIPHSVIGTAITDISDKKWEKLINWKTTSERIIANMGKVCMSLNSTSSPRLPNKSSWMSQWYNTTDICDEEVY